jgi:hypothetical protein
VSERTEWWLGLLEPGDPLWFNYPDSHQVEPYRFVKINDRGPRKGQPVYDEWVPVTINFPKTERGWHRKVTHPHFLIPVPLHSEPWEEVMAGKWLGTREELLRAWRSIGALEPPQTWLDTQLRKVTG